MSDEFDGNEIANFAYISSTSIPSANANLNQQFTQTSINTGGNSNPSSGYAYFTDASGNGAYLFQTNSLQPQPNPFQQQPSVMFENFSNSLNNGQTPSYQHNPQFTMGQQVNPNNISYQETAMGTQNISTTNPFQNEQYLFSPNPQPQEIFSSTLNNGNLGTHPPTSFFNDINSNFTNVPNNVIRPESIINQIPQLQRFSCVSGNDYSYSSKPNPMPLQTSWSFAPNHFIGGTQTVHQVAPSTQEAQQNYLLRIEQVTLINAIPIASNNAEREQVSQSQTSTNIHHRYTADLEGLTVLSHINDNKPQVIKIDAECIKQMLNNNSSFYIQQFLNGPTGKVKKETCAMQTDGSQGADNVNIATQVSEPPEVVPILEPKELPEEEVQENLQRQSSTDYLQFDGRYTVGINESQSNKNESDSEHEPRTGENNNSNS